jgi:hypothetical protein
MKKTEYAEVHVPDAGERQLELDAEKKEDTGLPQFTKEVPVSTRTRQDGDTITMEHDWKESRCENIRAKVVAFRQGENLGDVHMVNARDGADTVSFNHGKTVYIFRKTTRDIARALYNAYSRVQSGLENIVGWMVTVLGTAYVISKVEQAAWCFDRRLAKHDNINLVESDSLDQGQKRHLCDMIINNLAALHSRRLVLGTFTLNSVLIKNDGIKFTDLRGLRATRKLSFCVEEFKSLMQYLFAIGMVGSEDRYLAIATYHAANEQACNEWYREKTGAAPKEALEVTDRLETEIFS